MLKELNLSPLPTPNCRALLHQADIPWTPNAQDRLDRYAALLQEWNAFAGLVAPGDLPRLETSHITDSLSLAPVIKSLAGDQARLLDIGSGGGFPAIPIKLALPGLTVTLLERNGKKVGFLRKVLGALHLENVTVLHGEFPAILRHHPVSPQIITARAVERPPKLIRAIADFLPPDAIFLCQFGDPQPHLRADMFHVEQFEDDWSCASLRRGTLHLLRHR
jgi:16S rRNA (guanine527-N7)-methyltransferase